ncbi:MAG: hypothetical protein KBD37_05945 [Burkholderiales bacterium]|nr:hypothetical protein [Burkholderiales bacterium]
MTVETGSYKLIEIFDHKQAIRDYKACTEFKTSCQENNVKFTIKNATAEDRKNLVRIKVDSCLFDGSDSRLRCDYLFQFADKFSCFVELKGTDIEHAVKQLQSSLQHIKTNGKRYAYVIAKNYKVPKIDAQKKKWILDFKNKYNAAFDMKSLLMEKAIGNLGE